MTRMILVRGIFVCAARIAHLGVHHSGWILIKSSSPQKHPPASTIFLVIFYTNHITLLRIPAGLGFEPRYIASKATVLPLDDPAGVRTNFQKHIGLPMPLHYLQKQSRNQALCDLITHVHRFASLRIFSHSQECENVRILKFFKKINKKFSIWGKRMFHKPTIIFFVQQSSLQKPPCVLRYCFNNTPERFCYIFQCHAIALANKKQNA